MMPHITRRAQLSIFFFITLHVVVIIQSAPARDTKVHGVKKTSPRTCRSRGCLEAASTVLDYLDETVRPCDDFYQFACGGFIEKNDVPEDKPKLTTFNIMNDVVQQQLKDLMEEPIRPGELKPFGITKTLYKTCLNTTQIEKNGLRAAKALLKSVGGWPALEGSLWDQEAFDWQDSNSKFREKGVLLSNFLLVYTSADAQNSSRYIWNCDPPALGLDREFLIEGLENNVVNAYYEYLVDLAIEFGAGRARAFREMRKVVEFEIALAKISPSSEEYRNITSVTNLVTIAELQKLYPSIQWKEYINNIMGIPQLQITESELVNVATLKYIEDFEKLISRTPKRVQANYLMSQFVNEAVAYLTDSLKKRKLEYKKVITGAVSMLPRWKECVDATAESMTIALGALYVRKYFNAAAKTNAAELITDLRNAFRGILEDADWIDETTKRKALAKADAINAHVAYPPEFLNDKELEKYYLEMDVSSDDFFQQTLDSGKFLLYKTFNKSRDAINKTDWTTHSKSTTVNAYYSFSENSIEIPAVILQGIYFNQNRPKYMNYGAIGFMISHEITHGFDDMGKQYDKDGELSDWWEPKTERAFAKKAQCVIDQYGNFTYPQFNMSLNGVNTQGENIADIGGAKEAYLAYDAWVKRNREEPRLPGLNYTPRQMFWISLANSWCSKERDEYLKRQILTDEHAPSRFRILGSLKNSEYFARDFNCPVGSEMNPRNKCRVW